MLHYIINWTTYRTFKNGLLLDYFTKRIFFLFSKFLFYVFTIFFGDKYLLEYMVSNVYNALSFFGVFLDNISKISFVKFFRVIFFCLSYMFLILFILYL